jgi:AcrR family transcriptional regulator
MDRTVKNRQAPLEPLSPKQAQREPNPIRRNEGVHRAALAAAEKLLTERGYGGVTMEAIATAAGCSNKTLYRWWPTKAALFMELYVFLADKTLGAIDTGSFAGDIRRLIRSLAVLFRNTASGMAMRGMIAEAQFNPVAAERFRDDFMSARRDVVRPIIRRGMERGEVDPKIDVEMLIDMTAGPLWYRLLLGHEPLSDRFARDAAEIIIRGVSPKS